MPGEVGRCATIRARESDGEMVMSDSVILINVAEDGEPARFQEATQPTLPDVSKISGEIDVSGYDPQFNNDVILGITHGDCIPLTIGLSSEIVGSVEYLYLKDGMVKVTARIMPGYESGDFKLGIGYRIMKDHFETIDGHEKRIIDDARIMNVILHKP